MRGGGRDSVRVAKEEEEANQAGAFVVWLADGDGQAVCAWVGGKCKHTIFTIL